jgi:hypothetical protein
VAPGFGPERAFALASEPIGSGPWQEVPEGGFVGIDRARRWVMGPLDGEARGAAA